jgi:hypothetical protein
MKKIQGDKESETAQTVDELEKVPISVFTAVGNEKERLQRRERLIELGKTCRAAEEQRTKKDQPNEPPLASPTSGDATSKVNYRFLLELYGDQPFMVRLDDPYTNLMPDDPDRSYTSRDLDLELE